MPAHQLTASQIIKSLAVSWDAECDERLLVVADQVVHDAGPTTGSDLNTSEQLALGDALVRWAEAAPGAIGNDMITAGCKLLRAARTNGATDDDIDNLHARAIVKTVREHPERWHAILSPYQSELGNFMGALHHGALHTRVTDRFGPHARDHCQRLLSSETPPVWELRVATAMINRPWNTSLTELGRFARLVGDVADLDLASEAASAELHLEFDINSALRTFVAF